uniref:Phospholipid phosphatase 7 (inactive) n=1 Tax=Sinocyclocheilus rhinocerous TaxID=307959 RepID=A0A673KJX0_9TELE
MPLNPSRSRAKDRSGGSSSVLGRPEFLSLNVPLRNNRAWRRSGQSKTHQNQQNEIPPEPGENVKERGETTKLPDEDCLLLNPSFRGIAINSLLAIDICLSKRLGVCIHTTSSWGSMRSAVTLLALTGHGFTWICGTLVCLTQSSTLVGQEVLINLLIGETLRQSCFST